MKLKFYLTLPMFIRTFLLNCMTFTVEISKLQYSQLPELGHSAEAEVILKILVGQKEEKSNLYIVGQIYFLICNS